MQNSDWFLISKKTVVEMRTELAALKTSVLYQHTQRDREATLDKIKILEHSFDSGLHKSDVVPSDCQTDSREVEKIISFIEEHKVDDDFDVMNELKSMVERL